MNIGRRGYRNKGFIWVTEQRNTWLWVLILLILLFIAVVVFYAV